LKKENNIERLFKDGFNSFEPAVPKNAWKAINNNLNTFGTAAAGKSIFLGVSMAVTSLVGLIGVNVALELKDEAVLKVTNPIDNQTKKLESNETVIYEKAIELVAKEDKVVSTDLVKIIKSSVVSEKQKEIAKVVLEEPLKDLLSNSELSVNENLTYEVDVKVEPTINKDNERSSFSEDKISKKEVKTEEKVDSEYTETDQNQADIIKKTSMILRIPNVFTPNGDFLNDEFYIETSDIEDFYVRVIDLKGNTIFESTDVAFKWNGMDKFNNKVPEGNYYCILKALGIDGVAHSNTSLLYIKR
jgi:gliding motility-associated-like protein